MNPPPSTIPPLRRLVHRLEGPEEFAIAVSGGSLKADFLAPRAAATHVEQYQTAAWAFDFHEAQVKARIRCELPTGWGSLGLMRGASNSSWYGHEVGRGVLVCTPPGEMIDGRIAPGFSCLSIAIPATVWEDTRALAGLERRGAMGASVHFLDEDAFNKIEARIRNLRALLEAAVIDPQWMPISNATAMEFSKDLLICAWTESGASRPCRDSIRNRSRLARRADDWMRAHLGESITIPEVCRALGVSRREIEYAFRLIHDESPRDYLQALRLNAIRRALICGRSDQSISHLALAHGVSHLSRFAANYRRMFGEYPTETRKA